jgi:2-polyprenyl-6-hydroxyphenyl methylase/3-demethylubiquinone-9 3-methyltransferase
MSVVQGLIARQRETCYGFDRRFVNQRFCIDGNEHFVKRVVPQYLRQGAVVYDIGGGKKPLISPEAKQALGVTVVGVDVDAAELARAPAGAYDRTIPADIQTYRGDAVADLVICQAVLEHVRSQKMALKGVFSLLKPGSLALVFLPCRNSIYARLNLILPEKLKQKVLFYVSVGSMDEHGFPAYYDSCTPRLFRSLVHECNGTIVEEQHYYRSTYFYFSFPTYALWRLWVALFHLMAREQACETFSVVFRKNLTVPETTTNRIGM